MRLENRPEPKSIQGLSGRIWQGLPLQLFLVAVLPLILLVLVVTFGSLELHHEAMRSLVADRNLRAVQAAVASLEREITHRGAVLELLSRHLEAGERLESSFQGIASDLAVFDGGAVVLGPDGQAAAFTGSAVIHAWLDSDSGKAALAQAPASAVGKAEYLPHILLDGDDYIPVRVNSAAGVSLLGLFASQPVLADVLAPLADSKTVTVMVVDAGYQVLFLKGTLAIDESLKSHPGIAEALGGSGGIDYYPTREGEHVIASSPISQLGWALMVEESWEDIASPLLQVTQNAPLVVVPILGLSLLALWFGLRQIVQPMQALESKAGDLARGDFDTIRQPVGGVPEIRRLQKTLIDMAAQLKEAQNSLHSYIGAITERVENERKNLARELHDDTLQSLIALGQQTKYARHWNRDAKVEKALDQILSLTDQGIKNLRRLVQGLRPIYIEDLGLATALAMQSAEKERLDGIKIHFQREGAERRLKPDVEMALYRITQEALSNVTRHSGARNAWILLHFRPDSLVLEIRDDGRGFNPPADPFLYARLGHYGLLGMYERCDLIGAKLTIHSSADEGTQVRVRLLEDAPLQPGPG
jgi:signal transduction histidine kinase